MSADTPTEHEYLFDPPDGYDHLDRKRFLSLLDPSRQPDPSLEEFADRFLHDSSLQEREKETFGQVIEDFPRFPASLWIEGTSEDNSTIDWPRVRGRERAWAQQILAYRVRSDRPFKVSMDLLGNLQSEDDRSLFTPFDLPTLVETSWGYAVALDFYRLAFRQAICRFLRLTSVLSDVLYHEAVNAGLSKLALGKKWKEYIGETALSLDFTIAELKLEHRASLLDDIDLILQYRAKTPPGSLKGGPAVKNSDIELLEEFVKGSRKDAIQFALNDLAHQKKCQPFSIMAPFFRLLKFRFSEKVEFSTEVRAIPISPKTYSALIASPDPGCVVNRKQCHDRTEPELPLHTLFDTAFLEWQSFYSQYPDSVRAFGRRLGNKNPMSMVDELFPEPDFRIYEPQGLWPTEHTTDFLTEMQRQFRDLERGIRAERCPEIAKLFREAVVKFGDYHPQLGSSNQIDWSRSAPVIWERWNPPKEFPDVPILPYNADSVKKELFVEEVHLAPSHESTPHLPSTGPKPGAPPAKANVHHNPRVSSSSQSPSQGNNSDNKKEHNTMPPRGSQPPKTLKRGAPEDSNSTRQSTKRIRHDKSISNLVHTSDFPSDLDIDIQNSVNKQLEQALDDLHTRRTSPASVRKAALDGLNVERKVDGDLTSSPNRVSEVRPALKRSGALRAGRNSLEALASWRDK